MKSVQDQYFELLSDLKNKKEDFSDIETANLDRIIARTNALFSVVTNSVELKLDAKISAEAINLSSLTFEKKLRNRKVTTMSFINNVNKALKEEEEGDQINIHKRQMNVLFKTLNSQFYGISFKNHYSLVPTNKPRKAKEIKRENNDERNEKCTKIEHKRMKEDSFSGKIDRIVKAVADKKIEYYMLIINPISFSKTIENIFYLSFAIKLRKVKFLFEDKKAFILTNDNKATIEGEEEAELNHFTSSLDYVEYKRITENLKIEKPLLD